MKLTARTDARDDLDLQDLCQRHIDGLWIPAHLSPEEAGRFALEHFERTVAEGLRVLTVEVAGGE